MQDHHSPTKYATAVASAGGGGLCDPVWWSRVGVCGSPLGVSLHPTRHPLAGTHTLAVNVERSYVQPSAEQKERGHGAIPSL